MIGFARHRLLAVVLVAACGVVLVAGQRQPTAPGPFSAAQAQAGRDAYEANCSSCHRPDLRGSGEAPALAGANFIAAWRDLSTKDLYDRIRLSMPPGMPGSLGEIDRMIGAPQTGSLGAIESALVLPTGPYAPLMTPEALDDTSSFLLVSGRFLQNCCKTNFSQAQKSGVSYRSALTSCWKNRCRSSRDRDSSNPPTTSRR